MPPTDYHDLLRATQRGLPTEGEAAAIGMDDVLVSVWSIVYDAIAHKVFGPTLGLDDNMFDSTEVV